SHRRVGRPGFRDDHPGPRPQYRPELNLPAALQPSIRTGNSPAAALTAVRAGARRSRYSVGAAEAEHGAVELLGGQGRFGEWVGVLGAEAVEHQVQVAAPGVRGDPVGRLDDPAVGPDDE